MDQLYETLQALLGGIDEIRYVDLDAGQLQLEKPPLSYPAILIRIDETREDMNEVMQMVTADISLTVINKHLSESNNLSPESVRERATAYMRLNAKIHRAMQGFRDENFESFSNRSKKDVQIRKGLKTVVQAWTTYWYEDAGSN